MDADAVGTVIGGYRVEAVIGEGGMSTVYRARHPRLPRSDALKVLSPLAITQDPTAQERFERESLRIAGLAHPNIVRIYDSGTDKDLSWLSMECIDGTDALGLLREHPEGLPLPHAVDLVRAIAEALDYSHARGVQHRDVKPSNILVDRSRTTVRYALGDFGIARGAADPRITQTGIVLGTVDYCAPEQLVDSPLDGSSDQYSLAATAVHLISGHRPYGTAGVATIAHRQLTAPPPRPTEYRPGLPPAIDLVIARAMAKEPAGRYASCREFAAAFAEAAMAPPDQSAIGTGTVPGADVGGPPPCPPTRPSTATSRRRPLRRLRTVRKWRPIRLGSLRRRRGRVLVSMVAIASLAVIAAASWGFEFSSPTEGSGSVVAGDARAQFDDGGTGSGTTGGTSPTAGALPRAPQGGYSRDPVAGGVGRENSAGPAASPAVDDASAFAPTDGGTAPVGTPPETAEPSVTAPDVLSQQESAPAEPGDEERGAPYALNGLAPAQTSGLAAEAFTGAAAPTSLPQSAVGGGVGKPSMRTATGAVDPCLLPATVLDVAELEGMQRGTAPAPILDCFARLRADPDKTIEFMFIPFDTTGPEADASWTAYEYAVATESGWRAYRTSVVVLGGRYVYCSLGRVVPGAGLFELYTLASTASGDSGVNPVCSRLPEIADTLIKTVGAL